MKKNNNGVDLGLDLEQQIILDKFFDSSSTKSKCMTFEDIMQHQQIETITLAGWQDQLNRLSFYQTSENISAHRNIREYNKACVVDRFGKQTFLDKHAKAYEDIFPRDWSKDEANNISGTRYQWLLGVMASKAFHSDNDLVSNNEKLFHKKVTIFSDESTREVIGKIINGNLAIYHETFRDRIGDLISKNNRMQAIIPYDEQKIWFDNMQYDRRWGWNVHTSSDAGVERVTDSIVVQERDRMQHTFYIDGMADTKQHFDHILEMVMELERSNTRIVRNTISNMWNLEPSDPDQHEFGMQHKINYRTYVYESWDGYFFYSFETLHEHLKKVGIPKTFDLANNGGSNSSHTVFCLEDFYLVFGFSCWEITCLDEIQPDGEFIISNRELSPDRYKYKWYHITHRYPINNIGQTYCYRIQENADNDGNIELDIWHFPIKPEYLDPNGFVKHKAQADVVHPNRIGGKGDNKFSLNGALEEYNIRSRYIADKIGTLLFSNIEWIDLPFTRISSYNPENYKYKTFN